MKEKRIAEIAQELGVAKSTVSRTVRHCSGVDADTRRAILRYMDGVGHTPANGCDIYVIVPDTPNYFWKEIYGTIEDLQREYGIGLRQNLYNTLADHDFVLRYLDEAERICPRVLVLAAEITPEIRDKVLALKDRMTVFLLAEYDDIPYTFYFGADPYADGVCMGECFLRHCPKHRPVIATNPQNPTIALRVKGFLDALRRADPLQYGDVAVHEYPLEYIHYEKKKLASSRLAAILSEWMEGEGNACLYVPFGTLALSGALQKARLGDRVVCLTHDALLNQKGLAEAGIAVSMNQDVRGAARAVFHAAVKCAELGICPDRKYTFIPSRQAFGE